MLSIEFIALSQLGLEAGLQLLDEQDFLLLVLFLEFCLASLCFSDELLEVGLLGLFYLFDAIQPLLLLNFESFIVLFLGPLQESSLIF